MYFYDTCALLNDLESAFDKGLFVVSTITFMELEDIKSSKHKDEDIKSKARQLLKLLKKHRDKYFITAFCEKEFERMKKKHGTIFVDNNDNRIISCAWHYQKKSIDRIIFKTDDTACAFMAQIAGLEVEIDPPQFKEYTGFTKMVFDSEDDTIDFYSNLDKEVVNGIENHYYFIYVKDRLIDKYKIKDGKFQQVQYPCFESKLLGRIKPKDEVQFIAMDCLKTNQLSMLRGPAGTGKSLLSMAYLFDLLERGKIEKIIIFCNTVAVAGAAKLGFYPGSRNEKLLDSQIGNFLASKLGSMQMVEHMINTEQLILLPMADVRGYDTTGMNAGIYITEAQNMDIELMRLALQRIGEDSIAIIEGDDMSQVDLAQYAGNRNGMKRASEVFRGQPFYGEVQLQTIRRSRIAEIAQKM